MNDYLELYHHGIKGQKWGVRRFQNEDGSLTPAGKERYGYDSRTGMMSREGLKLYQKDISTNKKHNKAIDRINKKYGKKEERIKFDIDSYKDVKDGLSYTNGRGKVITLFTKEDVKKSVNKLKEEQKTNKKNWEDSIKLVNAMFDMKISKK